MHTTTVGYASVRHNDDWSGHCEVTWTDTDGTRNTIRMPGTAFISLAHAVSADVIRARVVNAVEGALEGLV